MRALRIIPRVFALAGTLMLALSIWLYTRERAFVAGASQVRGTIAELVYERNTDGGGAYYPVIAFVDATERSHRVRSSVGTSPPSWAVGESVEVLYDPANPEAARIKSYFHLYLGSFITSILAVVFGGIGFTWIWFQRRAAALVEELRRSGERIQAKVVQIERRTSIRVNNRSPWRIVAQRQDAVSQAIDVFHSANIWFDPTEYVGETVTVFVDRRDAKRHTIDLEFLPKRT